MQFVGPNNSLGAKTPGPSAQVFKGFTSHALGSRTPAGEHSTRHTLLSMYKELPSGDISLEEFEQLALDRLRVLKGIEEAKLRNRSEEDIKSRAKELVDKHLKGESNEETQRRDHLSHYILRLAHCRTPELRKWFTSMEAELFRIRFGQLLITDTDKRVFLERSGLAYTPVEAAEMSDLRDKLKQVLQSQAMKAEDIQADLAGSYYKVPFTAVPDLVASRKVFLRAGAAYVSHKDLVSLVVQDFRAGINKGLAEINRRYHEMFPESDMRLRPLVAGLANRYLGSVDFNTAAAARHGAISLASLPAIAARHFPLCMQHLMTKLREDHHLRHQGRQQLGLFLKAVGLPLEDALMFWRSAFAPRIPPEKFEKEYAYNVRHNYGKEGNRKDYSAHNCLSIIRMAGGAAEFHGCPYRRMDEGALRGALSKAGVESWQLEEAVSKAKGGHFQLACACAFEGAHQGAPLDTGVNHPAEYYSESRRVWAEREGAQAPGAAAGAAASAGTGAGAAAGAGGSSGTGAPAATPASRPAFTPGQQQLNFPQARPGAVQQQQAPGLSPREAQGSAQVAGRAGSGPSSGGPAPMEH